MSKSGPGKPKYFIKSLGRISIFKTDFEVSFNITISCNCLSIKGLVHTPGNLKKFVSILPSGPGFNKSGLTI